MTNFKARIPRDWHEKVCRHASDNNMRIHEAYDEHLKRYIELYDPDKTVMIAGSSRDRQITIYVGADTYESLEEFSSRTGHTKSNIACSAVHAFINGTGL